METLREILNGVAGALVIVATVLYVVAVLRKKTRPSKATWIIWLVQNILTAGGMYQAGTLNIQIVSVVIADLIVVVLSFWYGAPGWKQIEKVCLVGAAAGFAVWIVTKEPMAAIVIGLTITAIGALPTVTKLWDDPKSEDMTAYVLVVLSSLAQTAAISKLTWEHALQPIAFLVIACSILSLILFRPPKEETAKT